MSDRVLVLDKGRLLCDARAPGGWPGAQKQRARHVPVHARADARLGRRPKRARLPRHRARDGRLWLDAYARTRPLEAVPPAQPENAPDGVPAVELARCGSSTKRTGPMCSGAFR